jgi:hypothetical protein
MKTMIPCECGEILGGCCDGEGLRSQMAVVEWMPEHLRASHVAAGNVGYWPHNGSQRVHVLPGCVQHIDQDEWVRVISGADDGGPTEADLRGEVTHDPR